MMGLLDAMAIVCAYVMIISLFYVIEMVCVCVWWCVILFLGSSRVVFGRGMRCVADCKIELRLFLHMAAIKYLFFLGIYE